MIRLEAIFLFFILGQIYPSSTDSTLAILILISLSPPPSFTPPVSREDLLNLILEFWGRPWAAAGGMLIACASCLCRGFSDASHLRGIRETILIYFGFCEYLLMCVCVWLHKFWLALAKYVSKVFRRIHWMNIGGFTFDEIMVEKVRLTFT